MPTPDFVERVLACFAGLATGDALGKQTETLPHCDVRKWYPDGMTGFHCPGQIIPRYKGKRYEWRVGETTDDTEQTLAIARAILCAPDIRHDVVGRELLQCSKSLHPGVSLWELVRSGDPARVVQTGDGCGAAMRVSPVGVRFSSSDLDSIVRGAYECSIPTHGGQSAICAAAAVAAAVSAALEANSATVVLMRAVAAAKKAEGLRPQVRQRTIADCIEGVYTDLFDRLLDAEYIAEHHFPSSPETIIPLAISLAIITRSAEETALIAANVGGDADSVASVAGAIAGALRPDSVNRHWFSVVKSGNTDDIIDVALRLAQLR